MKNCGERRGNLFLVRGLDVDGYYRVYSTHFGGPSLCIIQRMGNHYSVGAMTSSMGKMADMEWGYETEKKGYSCSM